MGVTSTIIVTALGATFKVESEIGVFETKVFAKAGEVMSRKNPIKVEMATLRCIGTPTISGLIVQFASMVSLL